MDTSLTFKRLKVSLAVALVSLALTSSVHAQAVGEPLLEVPVYDLPAGMTYDDYVAANLRISTGLLRGLIPGGVHSYAGDQTTSWWLKAIATAGFAAIVAGASNTEATTSVPGGYEVVTLEDGNLYQKVPISRAENGTGEVTNTDYLLRRVADDQLTDGGAALAGLGTLLFFGSYIYDVFEGIAAIEDARNQARFKYGRLRAEKQAHFKVEPAIDPVSGSAGVRVGMQF